MGSVMIVKIIEKIYAAVKVIEETATCDLSQYE
jgi:hypothetical protein